MKYFFNILFVALGIAAMAQTDSVMYKKQPISTVLSATLQPIKGEKQYITSELIRTQGIGRLSELLLWIDKTTYSTINGDRFYLNIAGTSTQQHQNVMLMVNGQKVELERWDALNINLLGISVIDIAYVEIFNTPQIINGQFCGFGAINIVTRNDFKGFTYRAVANNGNPINDPGAAKYIAGYSSPNIDKTGFVYSHSLGYYANKFHINTSFNFQDWYARDTMITARYLVYPKIANKNTLMSFRAEGAGQYKKVYIQASAAYTAQDEFLFRNFTGSEQPFKTGYLEGTLGLTRTFTNNRYAKINTTINQHTFNNWLQNSATFTEYKYLTNTLNAEVGKTKLLGNNLYKKYTLGYTLNYYSYSTSKGFIAQHQPYAGLKRNLNKKITQQLEVMLNIMDYTINPNVVFSHQKNNNIISSWHFVGAYQQTRLAQFLNQTWYHYGVNRNSSINNPTITYPSNLNSTPTHKLSGDYFYKLNFGSNFRITMHGGLRYTQNVVYLIPNANNVSFLYNGYQTSAAHGNVFGKIWGANIHYDVLTNFWFDIDYYSANNTSNQKELQQVLSTEAKRKLLISAYYKLPARFDVAMRTQTLSKTAWQNYENGVLQTVNIPSIFNTDVSINKKMWGERININATLKNIFNQKEWYHPLGANFATRFMVTAQIKFDQLPKKLMKP
ncbi:MAG: hypothetical protein ACK44D_06010 [Bacteroidia bacterium]